MKVWHRIIHKLAANAFWFVTNGPKARTDGSVAITTSFSSVIRYGFMSKSSRRILVTALIAAKLLSHITGRAMLGLGESGSVLYGSVLAITRNDTHVVTPRAWNGKKIWCITQRECDVLKQKTKK